MAVAYADCGSGGGIDRVCEEEGVERIAGPHCYAFFDGVAQFTNRAEEEMGAFFLTDFLVRPVRRHRLEGARTRPASRS